jgi:hypothetical protein
MTERKRKAPPVCPRSDACRRLDESLLIQLGFLLEASGGVQTAVGKVLRWGLGAADVVTGETNRQALCRDLDDLKAAIRRVEKGLQPPPAKRPLPDGS